MSEIAELFYPAIRWDSTKGYEAARTGIDEALSLGVGGFILFGGPSEHVAALTEDLHSKSRVQLLIGADLERGAGPSGHHRGLVREDGEPVPSGQTIATYVEVAA